MPAESPHHDTPGAHRRRAELATAIAGGDWSRVLPGVDPDVVGAIADRLTSIEEARAEAERLVARVREQAGELQLANEQLEEQAVELEALNDELRDRTAAAETSEARYRTIFDASPVPLWVYDVETRRFLAVNVAAAAVYGWSREEFLGGMTLADIRPAEDVAAWEARYRAAAENRAFMRHHAGLHRHRTRDGRVLQVEVVTHDLEFEGRAARLALAIDLTDRMAAERARAELAAIVDSAEDAIMSVTPDGLVTTWNAGAERLYGWTAEEMIGASILRIVPEPLLEETVELLERLRAGERVTSRRTWRVRRDGTRVDTAFTAAPVRDHAGQVVGMAAISRDIADELAREAQARRSSQLEAIGLLASGVAHDFNNLLTVVLSNAASVRETLPPGSESREELDEVIQAARTGADLARQLLAFGRREALAPALLDVHAVARDAARLLARMLADDVRLELDVGATPAMVWADASQLVQVLMNLVVNARDAMPGGGTVTVETRGDVPRPAQAAAAPAPTLPRDDGVRHDARRGAMIRVRDTGTGMDAEALARAFEPFYTTKPAGEGTGVGLGVVESVVRQGGGAVWIESARGRGTTVSVWLPAATR